MIFTVCLTYLVQILPSKFIAESQSVVISLAPHTLQSIEGCGSGRVMINELLVSLRRSMSGPPQRSED